MAEIGSAIPANCCGDAALLGAGGLIARMGSAVAFGCSFSSTSASFFSSGWVQTTGHGSTVSEAALREDPLPECGMDGPAGVLGFWFVHCAPAFADGCGRGFENWNRYQAWTVLPLGTCHPPGRPMSEADVIEVEEVRGSRLARPPSSPS